MKKAFTLIELLVVIAIIAILAAILFPVFAQAKAAAKKTADLSNTKQHALATHMYVGDYDDMFPRAEYKSGVNLWGWNTPFTWREAILPYVKNGMATYRDGAKSQVFADGGLFDTPAKPGARGSYQVNNIIFKGRCQWDASIGDNRCDQSEEGFPTGSAPMPSVPVTALDAPAQIATSWTVGIHPGWNASADVAFASWWFWGGKQYPPVWNGPTSGEQWDGDRVAWWEGGDESAWMPRYRYTGGLNAGWGDGHAKFVRKGTFNWCKNIYVQGYATDWNEDWSWLFSPGWGPCAPFAR